MTSDFKRAKNQELIDYFVKLSKIEPGKWRNDDVIFKLARGSEEGILSKSYTPPLYYNVSEYIRDFKKIDSRWYGQMEDFIRKLDEHVKIDPSDPQHRPIATGLDIIVDRIVRAAQVKFKKFKVNGTRKAGSFYAGTRVGRPYEADIQIILDKSVKAGQGRSNFIHVMVETIKTLDVSDLKWSIHGVDVHHMGVCMFLECNEPPLRREGVQVDLVPVVRGDGEIPGDLFSPGYKTLISRLEGRVDLAKYEVQGLQRGLGFDLSSIDHQVLKYLPEDTKIAYRVAKYLLQCELALPLPSILGTSDRRIWKNDSYSDALSEYLYGYKPLIRSHPVHVILLQLIVQIQDTPAERDITIPMMTFIILDIVCQFALFGSTQRAYPGVALYHPAVAQPEDEDPLPAKKKGDTSANTVLWGVSGIFSQKGDKLYMEDTYLTSWSIGDVNLNCCLNNVVAAALKLLNTKLLSHIAEGNPRVAVQKHKLINKSNWLIHQYFDTIMSKKQYSDGYPDFSVKTFEIKLNNQEIADIANKIVQTRKHPMWDVPFSGLPRSDEIEAAAKCHDCATEGCYDTRPEFVEPPPKPKEEKGKKAGDDGCVVC